MRTAISRWIDLGLDHGEGRPDDRYNPCSAQHRSPRNRRQEKSERLFWDSGRLIRLQCRNLLIIRDLRHIVAIASPATQPNIGQEFPTFFRLNRLESRKSQARNISTTPSEPAIVGAWSRVIALDGGTSNTRCG